MASQELLEQALAEAYASAPVDQIPLDTLEINHPTFTQPIRVVRWPVTGPEPSIFKLRHEDDAEINPGELIDYIGFPFELKMPEITESSEGQFELRLAVHKDIDDVLLAAALGRGIITATYRQYIKGMEGDGPAAVWTGIEIQAPRREGGDIVANGVILGWMRRPFGSLYTPGKYPGLVAGR